MHFTSCITNCDTLTYPLSTCKPCFNLTATGSTHLTLFFLKQQQVHNGSKMAACRNSTVTAMAVAAEEQGCEEGDGAASDEGGQQASGKGPVSKYWTPPEVCFFFFNLFYYLCN